MIPYESLGTILTMSVTGSIIAVILFALKPFVRDRLPKSIQYYLWLVVLAALVVPISKFVVLPDSASNVPTISRMVDRYIVSNDDIFERISPYETVDADGYTGVPESSMPEVRALIPNTWVSEAVAWFRLVHYSGAIVYLAFVYCSYIAFMGKIKRNNITAAADEQAMLAKLSSNNRVPLLYRSRLAATPILIGVFCPAIILPDREYTKEQLHAVLLHELTHLRRKDVLVKWLSVLVTALHWFNPIIWLARREINRACELSCDEGVIHNLDTDGKRNYGETLLYVAADSKTPHGVLSTTMCEEKKALKERLGAIMKSKKHTRLAVIVSAVLLAAVVVTAIALGVGSRAESGSNYNFDYFVVSGYKLNGYMDAEAISKLSPTEQLHSESGYDYNFEEIRFDLDDNDCITRFQLNVYDTGIFNMWVEYSDRHPYKREGNNGLAFLGDGEEILRRISQVEALLGEGEKGWYDREQGLRSERYTSDNGNGEVTFVYSDGEDNGILNRLVWVIADNTQNLYTPSVTPEKTPLLDVNLVTDKTYDNSQIQTSLDIRAAQLTNDWYVEDENGDGVGYSADSFHPLQKQNGYDDVTLLLNNSGIVTLLFSDNYPPQSVSVQRWNAIHAGTDSVDVWDKGEPINVTNNTFQVSGDGNDYIYEVYAKWQEGSSWYVFYIESAAPSSSQSPDTYLPQIMHDSVIYYLSDTKVDIAVNLPEDAPRITSVVLLSELPDKNGQANFGEVGNPYILYGEGLLVLWNNSWEYFVPHELPNKESTALDVSMVVDSISSGGLSFVFENMSDQEYTYGSDYVLFVQENDTWEAVDPIIENWGFNSEGYMILPKSTTEVTTVDWRWLYGELASGNYLFQKTILYIRQPGDFDKYTLEWEFTLP